MRQSKSTEHINTVARGLTLAYRSGQLNRNDYFEEIFNLVQPSMLTVFRYAFSIVAESDQDDLFQDTMMRFARFEHRYDADRPLLPWLYQVARNVGADHTRKVQQREQHLINLEQAETKQNADDEITQNVDSGCLDLARALERLTENDRSILVLRVYLGFTVPELSALLALPISTIKAHIRRASDHLNQLLDLTKPAACEVRASLPHPRGEDRRINASNTRTIALASATAQKYLRWWKTGWRWNRSMS